MRRFWLAFLVVAVSLTPSLDAWCAAVCDEPVRPEPSACHQQEPATGDALSAPHDCSQHAPAPALGASATTRLRAPLFVRVGVEIHPHILELATLAHHVAADPPDRAPDAQHAPLRL
jgi:hypothetical protein